MFKMNTGDLKENCVHCERQENVQNLVSFEKKVSAGRTSIIVVVRPAVAIATALEDVLGVKLSLTRDNRKKMKLCVHCLDRLQTCYQVRCDFLERGTSTGFVSQLMNRERFVPLGSSIAGPTVRRTLVNYGPSCDPEYKKKYNLKDCIVKVNTLPDHVLSNRRWKVLSSNSELPKPSKRARPDVDDDLNQDDMWSYDCDWNDSPPSVSEYLDVKFEVSDLHTLPYNDDRRSDSCDQSSEDKTGSSKKINRTSRGPARYQFEYGVPITTTGKVFYCPADDCNATFSFEAMQWAHEVTVHNARVEHDSSEHGVHQCIVCDKLFCGSVRKYTIIDHMFCHSKEMRFKCPEIGCDYRTHDRRGVYKHSVSTKAHRSNKTSKPKVSVKKSSQLSRPGHNDSGVDVEQSRQAAAATASSSQGGRALRLKFKCRHCHKSLLSSEALKSHETAVHRINDNVQNSDCDSKLNAAKGYHPHSKSAKKANRKSASLTKNLTQAQYGEVIVSNKTFHCSTNNCNETFPFKAMLWAHEILEHSSRVPHISNKSGVRKCTIPNCGKLFLESRKQYVLDHTFSHSKEMRFKCREDGCDFRTWVRRRVYFHYISQHDEQHKSLKLKTPTSTHLIDDDISVERFETKSGESPSPGERAVKKNFKCSDCRYYTFSSSEALKRHQRTNHQSEDNVRKVDSDSEPDDGADSQDFDERSEDEIVTDSISTKKTHKHPVIKNLSPWQYGEAIVSDKTFHCSTDNCNETFPFKAVLWAHEIREHSSRVPHISNESGVLRCTVPNCGKLFLESGKEYVLDHTFSHSMEMRFKCPVDDCDYKTWSRRLVYNHFISKNDGRHEPLTLKTSMSTRSIHGDISVKRLDTKPGPSPRLGDRALREKFKCCDCPKIFLNGAALKRHEDTAHQPDDGGEDEDVIDRLDRKLADIAKNKRKKKPLNKCSSIKSLNSYGEPITREKTFQCSVEGCNEKFSFEALLWVHELMDHVGRNQNESNVWGVYTCTKCDKRLQHKAATKISITDHMFRHSKEKRFKCPENGCEFITHERDGVYFHSVTEHDLNQRPRRKSSFGVTGSEAYSDSLESLTCSNCHRVVRSNRAMHQHLKTCVSFKCPCCPYSSSYEEQLNAHMLSRHEGQEIPTTRTDENNTLAVSNNNDESRVSTVIQSTETYNCPEESCGLTFSFRANMLAHVVIEHLTPEDSTKLTCNLCNYTWNRKRGYALDDHMFAHTKEIRFRCPIPNCNYKCWTRRGVPYHLKEFDHTRKYFHGRDYVKPITSLGSFECPQCPVSFGFEAKLFTHIQIEHSGKTPEGKWQCHLCDFNHSVRAKLQDHYFFKHTMEHRYKCGIDNCEVSNTERQIVCRHVQIEHFPDTNQHMCDICGKLMISKERLTRHLYKVHTKVKPMKKERIKIKTNRQRQRKTTRKQKRVKNEALYDEEYLTDDSSD